MNHIHFAALTCASLFALGNTCSLAHAGHDDGAATKPKTNYAARRTRVLVPESTAPVIRLCESPFDQQRTPFAVQDGTVLDSGNGGQSLPGCRGGCCNPPGPASTAPFGFDANISTNAVAPCGPDWNRSGRDLQALAYQLEFTAEIALDELRFESTRVRGAEQLLAIAQRVQQQAQHFRTSLLQNVQPSHLRRDLENVSTVVDALSRSLSSTRGNTAAARAVSRVQRIVGEIASRLDDQPPVVNQVPQLERWPFDSGLRRPTAQPLVIPAEAKGIALLSPADQRAALAQKTCPVTGALLGAHGEPLKVQVGGQTIFVCCRGCVGELQANPDKYLAAR